MNVPVGTQFGPLKVLLVDHLNNPLKGFAIVFEVSPVSVGAGIFGPQQFTVVTDAAGVANTGLLTANGVEGYYKVSAKLQFDPNPRLFQNATGFSIKNGPPTPVSSLVLVGGASQSAQIGTAFSTRLQVKAKDNNGQVIPFTTVRFTAPPYPATGTFGGSPTAEVMTDPQGVATAPTFTANMVAGPQYAVIASTSSTSVSLFISALMNTVGLPYSVTATAGTGSLQGAIIGSQFAVALKAIVKDAGGNPVPGVVVAFDAGPGGRFGNATQVSVNTDGFGIATAPALTAVGIAGNYAAFASVVGAATEAIFSLSNTAVQALLGSNPAGIPHSTALGSTQFNTTVSAPRNQ